MRKFIFYFIPIALLAIFVFVMLGGTHYKNTKRIGDEFPQLLETVINNISDEHWDAAGVSTAKLQKSWDKVVKRIQFSAERDEMRQISTNIARLNGAVKAKDKANSLIELYEMKMHWNDMGE